MTWPESSELPGAAAPPGEWVLLTYRIPREPSTPRITVWRRFRQLGVAQLGDGLVGLPADARTREQLEWVAEQIVEFGGTAGIWIARPTTLGQERELAEGLAAARADEYRAIVAAAADAGSGSPGNQRRVLLQRLRAQWRAIDRRDFFPPLDREHARQAITQLAATIAAEPSAPVEAPAPGTGS